MFLLLHVLVCYLTLPPVPSLPPQLSEHLASTPRARSPHSLSTRFSSLRSVFIALGTRFIECAWMLAWLFAWMLARLSQFIVPQFILPHLTLPPLPFIALVFVCACVPHHVVCALVLPRVLPRLPFAPLVLASLFSACGILFAVCFIFLTFALAHK